MQKVIFISEIGINWFGDIKLAKEMIDLSKDAGADIVKFQLYRPEELLGKDSPYLTEAKKGVPTKEQAKELKEYSDSIGIEWCASVFHPDLIKFTEELGVKRYKIASRSVKELKLLEIINETKKPVIISVGMSDDAEISRAICTLRDINDITILYCVCSYPTSLSRLDLAQLDRLRIKFGRNTGFSSHCPKISPSLAAVTMGASVIEHHVVKYKTMKGCDVSSSLTFKEFSRLIKYIRELEKVKT